MKRTVIVAALVILAIGTVLAAGGALDQKVKTDMDITFVIAGELAERGGLVQIVFLQKADAEVLTEPFQVPLTSVASVVRVPIPVGATYTYRFRRFDDVDRGQTKIFSVGTYGQDTTVDSIYVDMSGDFSYDTSYRLTYVVNMSDAENIYPCKRTGIIVVCDSSQELLSGLPG